MKRALVIPGLFFPAITKKRRLQPIKPCIHTILPNVAEVLQGVLMVWHAVTGKGKDMITWEIAALTAMRKAFLGGTGPDFAGPASTEALAAFAVIGG